MEGGGARGNSHTKPAHWWGREGGRGVSYSHTKPAHWWGREGERERERERGGGGGFTLTHTPSQCTGEKGRGEGKWREGEEGEGMGSLHIFPPFPGLFPMSSFSFPSSSPPHLPPSFYALPLSPPFLNTSFFSPSLGWMNCNTYDMTQAPTISLILLLRILDYKSRTILQWVCRAGRRRQMG